MIDEAMYARLLAGGFLFDDPQYAESPVEVSERDEGFITSIEDKHGERVGAAVLMLRLALGKT